MGRISGRLINVGLAKEAVRGTAVAPSNWIPKTDFDFDDKVDYAMDEAGFGVIEKTKSGDVVSEYAEGNLSGNVYQGSFGLILMALFGKAPTTTTVETTAKKHAFAIEETNAHQSLTLTVKEANSDLAYALAMLDSLKISYAKDDYVKFEASFKAKKGASATSTVSYTSEARFLPKHAIIKLATNVAGLAGASALTNIQSITLEFKKNLDVKFGLGSNEVMGIDNLSFEVTGSIEKTYEDTTYKALYTAGTRKALLVGLTDTGTTVGGSTNPSLNFTYPEIVFTSWEKGMGNDDSATETLEFTGLMNLSAGNAVSAELVNGVASY